MLSKRAYVSVGVVVATVAALGVVVRMGPQPAVAFEYAEITLSSLGEAAPSFLLPVVMHNPTAPRRSNPGDGVDPDERKSLLSRLGPETEALPQVQVLQFDAPEDAAAAKKRKKREKMAKEGVLTMDREMAERERELSGQVDDSGPDWGWLAEGVQQRQMEESRSVDAGARSAGLSPAGRDAWQEGAESWAPAPSESPPSRKGFSWQNLDSAGGE